MIALADEKWFDIASKTVKIPTVVVNGSGCGAMTKEHNMEGVRKALSVLVVLLARVALAGSYTCDGNEDWSHAVSSDGSSNSYRIQVPAGFVAIVSLELEGSGFTSYHAETSTFSQRVDGTLKTLLGRTTEFLSDATITLSASCTADLAWTEIWSDYDFDIADVPHHHYTHTYHRYSDFSCRVEYRLSVSYERLLPDLVVSALSLSSADAAADETVSLSFTVRNAGRKSADSSSVARIYDGTTRICGDQVISALRIGEAEGHTVVLPALAVGMHELRVEVDSTGAVAESFEQNNVSTIRLRDYARTPVAVTFDTNGGDSPRSFRLVAGEAVGSLPVPTLRGYDFAGWWTERSGGYRISESEKITMERTFFAHWTARSCAIAFNRQGGTGGDGAASAVYDSAMPVVSPPHRTGFAFDGYWSEPNGHGVRYYNAHGIGTRRWDVPLAEVALYANWIGSATAVTLDTGGFGRVPDVTATFGSALPPVSVPTRSGWRFMGYCSSRDGKGIRYYDTGGIGTRVWDIIGETMTLYAHWLPVKMDYRLALDWQNGSGVSGSVVARYASGMPAVKPPSRAQYAFGGYYTEPNGGGVQYYDAFGRGVRAWDLTPENGRLYAKWTKAHHVVLNPNGGSGSPRSQYFTDPVWRLQANGFTRSGYVFAGWAKEADGAPVFADEEVVNAGLLGYGDNPDAGAVTLYAVWGRRLTTELFPGFSFVTGGTGADAGWRVEDGVLRSAPTAELSWLCVRLDARGTLDYAWSNGCPRSVACRFDWANDVSLRTAVCEERAEDAVDLPPGRHLAVWSCAKTLELTDWGGGSSPDDLVGLSALIGEKSELTEGLVQTVVNDVESLIKYDHGVWRTQERDRLAAAIRGFFNYYRNGNYVNFKEQLRPWISNHTGFDLRGLRGALENPSSHAEGERILAACADIKVLLDDILAIERFTGGVGVLQDLTWSESCLVGLALNDGRGYDEAMDRTKLIADSELTLKDLVSALVAKVVPLIRSRYSSWSDYLQEKVVSSVQWAVDYDLAGNYTYLEEEIFHRLADPGGLDTTDYKNAVIVWQRSEGKEVIDLCNACQAVIDEILAYRQEIRDLGVLEWRMLRKGARIGGLPELEPPVGYEFSGWWTAPNDGTVVSASLQIKADTAVFARWSEKTRQVTFDANGGTGGGVRTLSGEDLLGEMPVPSRAGFGFVGWYDAAIGGTAASIVDLVPDDARLFAQWTKDTDWASAAIPAFGWAFVPSWTETAGGMSEHIEGETSIPFVTPSGAFAAAKARTDPGVLTQNGVAVGVLQVKVGKASSKGESKVSVTVIGVDGKKYTAKAVKIQTGGTPTQTFEVKKFGTLTLTFGANGFSGTLNGATVTSVDAVAATTPGKATFGEADFSSLPGVLTDYLPKDETVTRTDKKWTVAKAGKLKYVKPNAKKNVAGGLQATGTNIAGLKLTYAAKTQTFKGSFKIWTFDPAKNKLKSVSAKVTGVVVNGTGYGEVTVKKLKIGELTVQ